VATRPDGAGSPDAAGGVVEREQQRAFYEMYLRAVTNRRHKPYEEDTIRAYLDAVISLEAYLARTDFPGEYQELGVGEVNAYLADYRGRNGQGGTVTKQSNLRVFFAWLAREYQIDNVYLHPDRNRYARQEEPPPILADDLIAALLRTTRNERIMHNVRDQALLRVLLTGMRRKEVAGLRVEDLDLRAKIKTAQTVGMKGSPGRTVPLPPKTVLALARWLRVRARFGADPDHGPLWIDASGRRLLANGIYQMLKRRTVEAGYPASAVHPHMFRHTAAHEWLAEEGLESDLVELMGWKDPSMVYRYTRAHAHERALRAAATRNFGDRH
jgi:site-specific recombinase XerD